VRHRRLSLWQSAVAHYLREEARTADPTLDAAGLSRSVRGHPMMRAATAHALCHAKGTPLHEGAEVIQRQGTNLEMASLSQLYFEIAEAQRTDNKALLALLETVPPRRYSTADTGGWIQCVAWYLVYYYDYPLSITTDPIIPSGPEKHKPMYRDWKDPKFGNGNLNYSVIPYRLPANAKIAIIGDWATGMDDAIALFDVVVGMKPDAIIHVGDIYYSGTPAECMYNFLNVVQQAYQKAKVKIPIFTLPGNHEYYSGGIGYYQLLDALAAVQPGSNCQQPASYFCLRTADDSIQFLGMDTGYNDHDPLDAVHTWTLIAPALQPNEIAWHQDKLNNFKGTTVLFSHHQLFSATATLNHYWYGTPYLNDSLYSTFQPYFESIAGWIWGHEHSLAAYQNNQFGLSLGRLVGASAYEETQAEAPYAVVYPEVPYLPGGPRLSVRNSYYNHSFAMMALTPGKMPSITYYEFPSWGSDRPPKVYLRTLGTENLSPPTTFTKQIWNADLSFQPGANVVNVIAAFGRVYASMPGTAFVLNPSTGEFLDFGQDGYQLGILGVEPRFATLGAALLIGFDGWIRSCDQDFLANWNLQLPKASGLVNMVTDARHIYAGSNGYVYQVDPSTSKVLHTNGLQGLGNYEVRLALGAGVLFVATSTDGPNGLVVLALNLSDLSVRWNRVPDRGAGSANAVNLTTDGQFLYVGCRGWVYKLDPNTGAILFHNNLPNLGLNEVRLAVMGGILYVGTNGSVLGLRTTDLTKVWKVNLPASAGNVVSVFAEDGQVFAGCNGLVYRMNPKQGAPFWPGLTMPGMGNAEVRLAMADDTLFAGANAAVRGVTTR
jgi:outer membrane protein assembly factor BamB